MITQTTQRWSSLAAILATLALCLSIGAVGCATGSRVTVDVDSASSPAEKAYLIGRARLQRGDYEGAISAFDTVRSDFPYSRFAALSELKIADAYFEQKQFASAAEQYRSFVKLHPNNERVAYARFRTAKSVYKKMPSDWFFMPPVHQRDLSATKTAVKELRSFLRRHADTKYADEAEKLLRKSRRLLADHEMYVAEFYLDRDNARAASMRLKYLLNNYSGLGLDPKALYLLARSYIGMGDRQGARTAIEDLLEFHAGTDYARKARKLIEANDLQVKSG